MNSIVENKIKELKKRKPYRGWIYLRYNLENKLVLYGHNKICCAIEDIKDIEVDGLYQIIKIETNNKTIMIDQFSFYSA